MTERRKEVKGVTKSRRGWKGYERKNNIKKGCDKDKRRAEG
jgi:hypothetical protein